MSLGYPKCHFLWHQPAVTPGTAEPPFSWHPDPQLWPCGNHKALICWDSSWEISLRWCWQQHLCAVTEQGCATSVGQAREMRNIPLCWQGELFPCCIFQSLGSDASVIQVGIAALPACSRAEKLEGRLMETWSARFYLGSPHSWAPVSAAAALMSVELGIFPAEHLTLVLAVSLPGTELISWSRAAGWPWPCQLVFSRESMVLPSHFPSRDLQQAQLCPVSFSYLVLALYMKFCLLWAKLSPTHIKKWFGNWSGSLERKLALGDELKVGWRFPSRGCL